MYNMVRYQALCIVGIISLTLSYVTSGQSCSKDGALFSSCTCDVPSSQSLEPLRYLEERKLTCKGDQALSEANKVAENTSQHLVFTELEISDDSIAYLSYRNLKKFAYLKTLILSGNELSSVELNAFKNLTNLKKLDLSGNRFSEIKEDMFDSLKNLKFLSLADNNINSIDTKAFSKMPNLLSLDLSGNHLTSVNSKWFESKNSISFLSLQSNGIESVEEETFQHLAYLENLDLSNNELNKISNNAFWRNSKLKTLSLAQNNLKTFNEGTFSRRNSMLEKVNLAGNPWVCDKNLLPLIEFFKKYEADKESTFCAEPEELRNLTLQHGLEALSLELNINEDPTCNATMCNCSVSRDKLVITVDCRYRGFTRLPETLPYKTKVLDVRGNNIRSLTIDHIDADRWSNVTFLYLNNNLIDSMKGLEGTSLLRNLIALHLTNNKLTEIPKHILAQFHMDELYLSGNPWNCDCNTVNFQTWLQDNYKTIRDLDVIRCSQASGAHPNQAIYRLKKSQLCPQDVNSVHILDVLNSLLAIAIIIIVCKLSYDYWLQKRTGKLPRFFSLNLK